MIVSPRSELKPLLSITNLANVKDFLSSFRSLAGATRLAMQLGWRSLAVTSEIQNVWELMQKWSMPNSSLDVLKEYIQVACMFSVDVSSDLIVYLFEICGRLSLAIPFSVVHFSENAQGTRTQLFQKTQP